MVSQSNAYPKIYNFLGNESITKKYKPTLNVNKLIEKKRKNSKENPASLDNDMLNFHKFNRAKEEIVMLKVSTYNSKLENVFLL